MSQYDHLVSKIRAKQSMLCVGLDTDANKIPPHLHRTSSQPELAFNEEIIKATHDICVAYKLNIAFYESMGVKGWQLLEETLSHIPEDILVIADAKRGDIANTSRKYAETFFRTFHFDAVTVAPYMGEDAVKPFLEYPAKWTIVLGLTSNEGSRDFQTLGCSDQSLYEHVIQKAASWGDHRQLMFVAGATHPGMLGKIRQQIPHHFLLVPGIGKQGGEVGEVLSQIATADGGALINVARSIIYADDGENFARAAREEALEMKAQMHDFIPS